MNMTMNMKLLLLPRLSWSSSWPSSLLFFFFFLLLTITASVVDSQEIPDLSDLDLQQLLTDCPAEIARITPCINTDTDISNCTACVSEFMLTSAAVVSIDNVTSSCEELQSSVCTGIDDCGSSCGLVEEESWFTFGSNCEDLFLNLVACVLNSYGVSLENCTLAGSSCNDDNTDPDSGYSMGGGTMMMMMMMTVMGSVTSTLFMLV